MISFLQSIFEVLLNFPQYLLYSFETFCNLFTEALESVVDAAVVLLPSLPSTFSPPTILGWANWFYPIGAVMAVASSILSCYVTFLTLRWIFKKAGIL